MEEEIIEFLKRVGAVSKETGRSFSEIMEATGQNYDTVWSQLRIMLDRQKAVVSDKDRLRQQSHMPYDVEFTKKWRVENHHPITAWLGPAILEEMDKRRREDEMLEALKAVASKPSQVIGAQFNGPASDVTTGPVFHDSVLTDSSIEQKVDRSSMKPEAASSFWRTQVIVPVIVAVLGGLLTMIFWEQIEDWFNPQ